MMYSSMVISLMPALLPKHTSGEAVVGTARMIDPEAVASGTIASGIGFRDDELKEVFDSRLATFFSL